MPSIDPHSPAPAPRAMTGAGLGILLFSMLLTGCPAETCVDDTTVDNTAVDNAPIVGESWLGLTDTQVSSLVRIRGEVAGERADCSGAVVGPRHVLTARHCGLLLDDETTSVHTADGAALVPVAVAPHPDVDALLIALESDAPSTPLPVRTLPLEASDVGTHALLTGFSRGPTPWFQVQPISDVDATHVVVDSGEAPGACTGDSGGPLLWRGEDGHAEIIGVLSVGAPGCRGEDRYVRVDALGASFFSDVDLARDPAAASACGNLPESGRCYGARAVWCEDDQLVAEDCARCGYSVDGGGYRCLSPENVDPCEGAPELGVCVDDTLRRCAAGTVEEVSCAACGARCAIDAAQNRATCVP